MAVNRRFGDVRLVLAGCRHLASSERPTQDAGELTPHATTQAHANRLHSAFVRQTWWTPGGLRRADAGMPGRWKQARFRIRGHLVPRQLEPTRHTAVASMNQDRNQAMSGKKVSATFCAKHPQDEFLAKGSGHFFPHDPNMNQETCQ